jgi:hypothetical protein
LDGLGDAEAQVFLQNWDVSVSANNIAKLLELERSLIDHAHKKMAVIDAMGLRALKRLTHRSGVGPLGQEALEHAPPDPNHAAVLTKLDPKLHGLPIRVPAGISPPLWRPVQRLPTRGSGSSSHTGNMPPAVSTLALTHQRAINDCA